MTEFYGDTNVVVMAIDKPRTLGELIRVSRSKLGITQRDLLTNLSRYGFNYTEATISNWENDNPKARPPLHDPQFVNALADVLEVPVLEIMEIAGFNVRAMLKNPPPTLPDWLLDWVKNASPKQLKRIRLLVELLNDEDEN